MKKMFVFSSLFLLSFSHGVKADKSEEVEIHSGETENEEIHSEIYLLENEQLDEILSAVMEVSAELDGIDERLLEGTFGINGLHQREKLIEKADDLETQMIQLLERVEYADYEDFLLPGEKNSLEKKAKLMELYEYENLLKNPFSILSHITNLGVVSNETELEELIDDLLLNHSVYSIEYKQLLEGANGQHGKIVNINKLAHIISHIVRNWIKLDKVNAEKEFKESLSEEYNNKLRESNHLYRKFLKELYLKFIKPALQLSEKGSFFHARFVVAMLLSLKQEKKFLELNFLMNVYRENSIPLPDLVDEFLKRYHFKSVKLLQDIGQFILFGPEYSRINIKNLGQK